ncbi:MAG: glycerol-3-phosphate acyltransferase, partial [Actinobacteria bacterium]|nr:glycerol-3-phosphate acyltransferase [Actinomycetota bacterium]
MTGVGPLLALFEGIPRSATAVGVLAGPLIVLGYVSGSVPFAYLLSRRRLRRQLDDRSLSALGRGDRGREHHDVRAHVGAGILAAAATMAATTLAWQVTLAATPGANTFSAVAVFSNQAIGAWVSVALWTGMAAVLGHIAPVWTGFRGGDGLAPALALTTAYTPLVLLMAAAVFLVVPGETDPPGPALVGARGAGVGCASRAWVADRRAGGGVRKGPEGTVWRAGLGVTRLGGRLRGG